MPLASYAKYVQLATVRLDGRPANRTVVFRCVCKGRRGQQTWAPVSCITASSCLRGFLKEGQDLTFVTDARSHKAGDSWP